MKPSPRHTLIVLLGLLCVTGPSLANDVKPLLSGEQVYRQHCIACHGSGVAKAPKAGDAAIWKPLIAEGQAVLTAHAWVGVRAMPAQGGAPRLSLEEFARGVAWMARESGGAWQDPDAATLQAIRKEVRQRLQKEIASKQKMLAELSRQP